MNPLTPTSVVDAPFPRFVRAVGLFGLIAIAVNGVIGSGIFVLPATVASLLGPASLAAYIVAALLIALIVACFAEAGSMFEQTGGPYLYAREAFGSFVGLEVGWMFLLSRLAATSAIANAFTAYLGYFWPLLGSGVGRAIALTVLLWGLAWLNVVGVRYGSWTVNVWSGKAGEIARARLLYEQRVAPETRLRADYFHDELVRTLAEGDPSLLERS
jgi:amino acid transporter